MGEDYRTSLSIHYYINIVYITILSTPPTIQCRGDLGILEFDRAMEKQSTVIDQYLTIDRIISNFRVRRTRSGYATYKDKQLHGISDDLLACKWGI